MKKFLIYISGFSILVFILFGCVELLLLLVPNEYTYKLNYLKRHKDDIKCLVIGNSHASTGIDAGRLGDSAFNAAISGRFIYYDAKLAELYIPKMRNLRSVIMPLSYDTQYFSYQYEDIWNYPSDFETTPRCMYAKYAGIYYNNERQYCSEILFSKMNLLGRLLGRNRIMCDSLGLERFPLTERRDGWDKVGLVRKRLKAHKNAEKCVAEITGYFEQICKVCNDANVQLILFTVPYYKTARDSVTQTGISEMHSIAERLCTLYGAKYYDYMCDNRFFADDFKNATHLNEQGAAKLSDIIREDFLK